MAATAVDGMDWISINTGCFAISNAIAKTLLALDKFVREVRESRSDLDDVASLLHSLDRVLDLLKDDAAAFPPRLAHITPPVLDGCQSIVGELEGCIAVLGRAGVSRAEKKSRWMASRDHIEKLRGTLGGYKLTLGLAVDLVALANPTTNEERSSYSTGENNGHEEQSELATVATRISDATSRLQRESQQNGAFASLHRYLNALHSHAVTAVYLELDQLEALRQRTSSIGEAPDSAIELSYDDSALSFPAVKPLASPSVRLASKHVPDIDELLDELREMPSKPPTPPPRSRARSASNERGASASYNSPGSGLGAGESPRGHTPHRSVGATNQSHQRKWSFSPSLRSDQANIDRYVTPVTDLTPHPVTQPTVSVENRPGSRLGRALVHMRHPSREANNTEKFVLARPPTSNSSARAPSQAPSTVGRRSSSRLSSAFRGLSLRRKSDDTVHIDANDSAADEGAIFGVALGKSMLVARGVAGTRYDGGGSSSRDYPLCVLRCIYFIRDEGIHTPNIFGQDGDAFHLVQLKEIFSSPDTGYGKEVDWSQFTVHEAADLILLFLAELPQPLIPESVVKRWIVLSRQATISGSLSMRLDQGLDFWEEAFAGLRGSARALFKLLLNLWGDIADAADANDMTAERLAGRVMRPLMHVPAARYDTDMLLGLAFMIRKRSEYHISLGEKGRKSNAAF